MVILENIVVMDMVLNQKLWFLNQDSSSTMQMSKPFIDNTNFKKANKQYLNT